MNLIHKVIRYLRREGVRRFLLKSFYLYGIELIGMDAYKIWISKNEPDTAALEGQKRLAGEFSPRPKISIITPVFNPDKKIFIEMLESVVKQTYDNWELCLADASTEAYAREIIERYAGRDKRIKTRYLEANKGIAGNSNEALSLAAGDFIALLDHDDTLAPFALFEIVNAIIKNPDADFIYSDEDKISKNGKRRLDPYFKPDWSPDTLRSCNYITHLSVFRKELIDRLGGFREGFDGAQDYDLILRASEQARHIFHIPKVLYHWRVARGSAASSLHNAKPYAYEAAKKALKEHIMRSGSEGEVSDGVFHGAYNISYHLSSLPSVAIIIPTKDKVGILKKCVESVLSLSTYNNYTILIVDNQSEDQDTLKYYCAIERDPKIKIIKYGEKFNYSAVNNYAVKHVNSEYIIFLNNDTEVISCDWIENMLGFAQRQDVGAVGAMLYYPNETIQHAGVILGLGGIGGHPFVSFKRSSSGYKGRAKIAQNLSAVTAACMMVRKEVFLEAGCFDEGLSYAFNDVDLCLRIRQCGYLVVFTPFAELYHHESLTRGRDNTPEKQERFQNEIKLFRLKWKLILEAGDPYYSPNLTLEKEDFSIRL